MNDELGRQFLENRGMGPLADTMGLEITHASAEMVTGTMPVAGNTQPLGLLHGGANVVLAESLGSLAANIHAGPDRYAVGIEINATHLASATKGKVHGTAKAIKLGGTIAVYEIEIVNDAGELTCVSRLVCAIRNKRKNNS
ncbi:MAG: hotdog fold thioesterase [Actinobacteria bacterium]|nr:hotdog fold thioesterase [Actinomycetota bacterium]